MKHNVSRLTLLRNKDFAITTDNDIRVVFSVPTFEDYITNSYLNLFLALLELDRSQYEGLPIETHHDMILFMIGQQMYTEEILFTLHKYIPDLRVELKGFLIKDEILTKKELDFIIDVWRMSMGIIAYNEWDDQHNPKEQEDELDEFEKLIKEKEDKVRRIKNKKQKQATEGDLNLERILITVMKEFNFKMDDLLPMNVFTIFWYYQYGLKYNNYRIETIAYGNGLIKKMNHFSE